MEHVDIPHLLGLLAVLLVLARGLGLLASRLGQPAVLGELLAGVLAGASVFGLVRPQDGVLHALSELGVVLLLFQIGLETDLPRLLRVGASAAIVAILGVILPFVMGALVCLALGQSTLVAIVVGAALTATSVGITARVLADLGRLQDSEGQIILGAAVLDDVIGLVILTIVAGMTSGTGAGLSLLELGRVVGTAVGFLVITLMVGSVVVPRLIDATEQRFGSGASMITGLAICFGLAWLASKAGSAVIIGAFTAGLLVRRASKPHDIEHEVGVLGRVFVPMFFVVVGSAVDVRVLNPFVTANLPTLMLAGMLIVVAVLGKFVAGYSLVWFKGQKSLIGAGMIPRGEVGLIFAQMGLSTGVLDAGLFSAVTLTVMATTFLAPPLLRRLSVNEPEPMVVLPLEQAA